MLPAGFVKEWVTLPASGLPWSIHAEAWDLRVPERLQLLEGHGARQVELEHTPTSQVARFRGARSCERTRGLFEVARSGTRRRPPTDRRSVPLPLSSVGCSWSMRP